MLLLEHISALKIRVEGQAGATHYKTTNCRLNKHPSIKNVEVFDRLFFRNSRSDVTKPNQPEASQPEVDFLQYLAVVSPKFMGKSSL